MRYFVTFKTPIGPKEERTIYIDKVQRAFVSEYNVLIINGYDWNDVREFGMEEVEAYGPVKE